jgi:beta-galactosidase
LEKRPCQRFVRRKKEKRNKGGRPFAEASLIHKPFFLLFFFLLTQKLHKRADLPNSRLSRKADSMKLGVCYYPEHWPEEWWAEDAARMAALGLSRVRIGEFAWSRIEPEPGRYDWGWLDRAVETLHAAGLGIIMGTPTATPPKWLVDRMPDMIALDEQGRPRGFGSRRHYCFSHYGYAEECDRIVGAMAERYGEHPAIVAWQTDNEYGCHDTAVSYSKAAADAFRYWLAAKYGAVAKLNTAWGNVFWSMEYRSFAEIDLPNLTVTEANPAHWLDFRRFSSDQVVGFNRRQVDILRAASPGRDLVHNYMGFFTQFDHHAVAADLDVASWDSYPLGFLEQFWFSDQEKLKYARQGHPDIAAFHHDLYRGLHPNGRWWVMEQQPGPVNWARYNPAPLPGMVRLWTLEAMAHGAELVSYFRWRQAPVAQEQMHAGLLRPDRTDDVGAGEARQAAADIALLAQHAGEPVKQVALLFNYESDWVTDIQPQGQGFSALRQCFEHYSALRQLGLNVDILPPSADLTGYAMAVIPCMPIIPDGLVGQLKAFTGQIIIGPRSGSKTADFSIPANLAPGVLQQLIPLKVTRVESLRPGLVEPAGERSVGQWLEHVESDVQAEWSTNSGRGICYRHGSIRYLAGWVDPLLLGDILKRATVDAGLPILELAEGIRVRRTGNLLFAFNYSFEAALLSPPDGIEALIGERTIEPAGLAVWQV